MVDSIEFDFTKVKVKEEKLSPPHPSNAVKDTDELINELIPTLFGGSTKVEDKDLEDDKKSIEPVKSSNEILAELFKVFNAAPPETILNDAYLLEENEKKKHKKHKKHKKKSKKRDHSGCPDDENTSDDNTEVKSKKRHKKKKKKKSTKSHDDNYDMIDIKKEPPENDKNSNDSDFTISDLDEEYEFSQAKKSESVSEKTRKLEKVDKKRSQSPREPGKIKIKNLKTVSIFRHTETSNDNREKYREKDVQKKSIKKESGSELSLSDEETFLKERENREHFSADKSRDQNYKLDRDNQRDFYERKNRHNRYEHGSRRYRDPSWDKFKNRWRDDGDRRNRSRSRRRSRSRELGIDKKRLLEIARKNAITMFKKGSLPGTQQMSQEIKDKVLLKMRYGGKTVEDLTDFCKKLSNGDNFNDISDLSSNDDSDHDCDGNDKAFHHPFVLKDRGPIVMNIKNAIPIPPKSAEQTKAILMQFPVSSGQQHRLNESEWIPVPTAKKPETTVAPKTTVVPAYASAIAKQQGVKNIFAKPIPADQQQKAFMPIIAPSIPSSSTEPASATNTVTPAQPETIQHIAPLLPPPLPPVLPASPPSVSAPAAPQTESIFPQTIMNLDVSTIISKRLNAMRRLQENPMDSEAIKIMYNSQKDMSAWANSKHLPGQFTGSTGVNVLSARELHTGTQAWAKKDQLTSTTPVLGGMGMHLLQKMGWKPGEGLGRERNGALQPLLLEVKLDKKGLVADEEDPTRRKLNMLKRKHPNKSGNPIAKAQEELELKHPVSLLGELATKRRWISPVYELVEDHGPAHSKNFIFKVIVNGIVYEPSISANTKRQAKATAAKYCLQQMGVLPV